ncbi:Vesicle transport through interaction with t-SNAREs 1A isoform 2 [Schistosoma japonicum]|uniref:Vesicle transport through interaction with t-SNAREs homolog 1A n=1 Tax=Schistosoma japonicum TaxID=6182 RepID=Q5DFY4_SCHJA|nr:unknown [Schistosoma japonicum]KAH8868659.1 Vesicle transport through interaction with t-SNAREs likeA [Schistosoma japonicum]TNN18371.1 Vesicle transport through interaction with t-SNAREs 1A isoform 2 [Schistosoma japonicum]CAX74613.1 putative vesicle transport through interaction with t-SNAREs homolog 1A [Schistosoma japonicum]CAX74614.1 putative vesicle transport through interaction with t-SNAREs homolog 1A [Schistosoma japonicum]
MTLFESYEKQYGNLTSDITFKLGKIPQLNGSERTKEVRDVSALFDETRDLIDQMSLEVQEMRHDIRPKFQNRLECYRKELEKLTTEFKRPRYAARRPENRNLGISDDEDTLHEEVLFDTDMRAQLLSNTERISRTTTKLEDGVRIALETEEVGGHILQDLSEQREKLQRSRDRLRQADSDLKKSSRVLSVMTRRILQNKLLLIAVIFIMVLIFLLTIYLVTRHPTTHPNLSSATINSSHP